MRPGYLNLTLVLLSACSFDLGFDGTHYQCGSGGRCPEGQACVAGVCTLELDAPATDAADGGDAAPDGGDVPLVCGNLSLLRDTFDVAGGGVLFNAFNDTGATVTETGGELVVDLSADSDAYAGYNSDYFYDLHGGGLEAQVDEVAAANTILEVRNHLGNAAQLALDGPDIVAAAFNLPGTVTYAQEVWNPAEKFLRIREDGGDLVWELSTDRVAWRVLHRRALPFDVAHVRGVVSAGGSAPAASRARFEDVNLNGSAAEFCRGDSLIDDFATTPLGPIWEPYSNPQCTITESGGNLVMTYTGTTTSSFCGMQALHLFDMSRGNGVVIEGAAFPDRSNFVSYFQANTPGDGETRVEFTVDGTVLEVRSYVDGTQTGARNVTNDRTIHRYYRLRGDGSTAIFDTSPDRVTWNEFHRLAVPWDLSVAEINIGAGNYGLSTAATITIPGVNAD